MQFDLNYNEIRDAIFKFSDFFGRPSRQCSSSAVFGLFATLQKIENGHVFCKRNQLLTETRDQISDQTACCRHNCLVDILIFGQDIQKRQYVIYVRMDYGQVNLKKKFKNIQNGHYVITVWQNFAANISTKIANYTNCRLAHLILVKIFQTNIQNRLQRVHILEKLFAQHIYQSGHGQKGVLLDTGRF
ncbi:hypothetical protein BpHYR1_014518 [Brachionus plicatilis]|uniref:Uncharacterized protein n=1 Tax=Brachionus plicatilis TaxID=10195 RepID=A0A3M7SGL9_BRAPC|nr:hypothetical protein BpHYR1_014518 [Brachionus plicatilis]